MKIKESVACNVVVVEREQWRNASVEGMKLAHEGITQVVFSDPVLAEKWAKLCHDPLSQQ